VSLPSHASDTLSARLQAIGGTRTCTSLDSQRCRLLTIAPRHDRQSSMESHCCPNSRANYWSIPRLSSRVRG
jgi:hypothetical protein